MTAALTGAFPADLTKSAREESESFTMILKASGKPTLQSPLVEISGKTKCTITRQYKLLD
jgi:hypothetical protein